MSETPRKRLFIKTYGCQMNVYDSERMADVLRPLGYGVVDDPEGADLVVLNTCLIREKATEKVYSELGKLRDIKTAQKAEGQDTRIIVAGCVAQAEGAEIQRRQPAVDDRIPQPVADRLGAILASLAVLLAAVLALRAAPGTDAADALGIAITHAHAGSSFAALAQGGTLNRKAPAQYRGGRSY